MTLKKMLFGGSVCAAALLAFSIAAEAKRARCFTSDDGYFSCSYRAIDDAGSFRISAPGYPTYVLEIDGPGFAYGFESRPPQCAAAGSVRAQPRRWRLLEQSADQHQALRLVRFSRHLV